MKVRTKEVKGEGTFLVEVVQDPRLQFGVRLKEMLWRPPPEGLKGASHLASFSTLPPVFA